MNARPRVWLCVPPVFACACDVTATLVGQGPRYWSGDYHSAQELNPLVGPFLAFHPAAFALVATGWALLFTALLLKWRSPLATATGFAVTFGHAVGVASWLVAAGPAGSLAAVVWLAAVSRLAGVCWGRAGAKNSSSSIHFWK
ncbi:MAG: hypothetical protein U0835_22020 [Isosphaeraceae bacterium]